MPQSRRQSVMETVVSRFGAIDGTGNYNFNLAGKVFLWRDLKAKPWELGELPAVNVRDPRETTHQVLSGVHEHELEIEVDGAVAAGTAPDAQARKLLADLVEAIGQDRKWSELAYDTDPDSDEIDVIQAG